MTSTLVVNLSHFIKTMCFNLKTCGVNLVLSLTKDHEQERGVVWRVWRTSNPSTLSTQVWPPGGGA